MSFVNTREEIGERATLDGLIDGTLVELKDNILTTSFMDRALYRNTALKTLVMPKVLPGGYTFSYGSSDPTGVEIAVVGHRGSNQPVGWFYYCTHLHTLDWVDTGTGAFGANFAAYCANLKTLILRRKSGIVAYNNASCWLGSPLHTDGSGATVYVPSALLSTYQNATGWSAAPITWETIEGSEYENYYADGSPIE